MKSILTCIILCIILSACGKKENQSEAAPGPLQSTIPDQGCKVVANGMHEFKDLQLLYTAAYDCGVREGKQCWYFAAGAKTEVECE